jgi:hypothetical protein
METRTLALIVVALAALESVLVLSSILTPLLEYSPGNIVFLIARNVIVIYAGWSSSGIKDAVSRGAIISGSGAIVFVIASLIGSALHHPMLGISFPPESALIVYLALIVMNAAIGVIGALFAVLIAGLISPKKERGQGKSQAKDKSQAKLPE